MKKRALTLIEMMIVILLISLIGGAIGYNMKGALGKGKEFKTERAIEQLEDQLQLCVDLGHSYEEVAKEPVKYLKELGLAKNPAKLVVDGWGDEFTITLGPSGKDFDVKSKNWSKKE